jgi:serine/threonine-protein kinase HipA
VRDASTEPAIDLRNLLRWQIFNVLAGNSDGHAKNLSLLYAQQNHARLAPFYDLVCTRAIARIDRRLAFSVGGERDPEIIRLHHWEHEAENCGVRPRYLRELVQELARSLLGGLAAARAEFEQACGALPALQRVEQVVTRQCVRVLDDERGRARP